LARCGCGSGQNGAQITAGDNVAVSGTGSAANPYVISAQTDCTEVRGCLHAAAGVAYDPATGTFSTALSGQAGNNVTVAPDGGLFVPTGAATVSTGCGLTGDGSGSSPLTAKVQGWPFACTVDTAAGGVYCDSAGNLRTDPPKQVAYFEDGANTNYPNIAVPSALTTVVTNTLALANPDPCRAATAIVTVSADGSFILPGGASAAYAINGDEMWFTANTGTTTITNVHAQLAQTFRVSVPPGGTVNQVTTIGMARGAGGAVYDRVQWSIKAWVLT
jgi:hypothetical protein